MRCGRGYARYWDSALSPLLILFRFEIFGTVSFPFPRTLIESNFETKLDNSGLWSFKFSVTKLSTLPKTSRIKII